MINPKNNDEQRFEWVVIAVSNQKEIAKDLQHISKPNRYESQYSLQELEFPVNLRKIGMFKKKNFGITVKVLFSSKKGIYTARRSELLMSEC